MNTQQILKCLQTDSILKAQCAGVFPLDLMPPSRGRPECMVVNLDPQNKPGSHWIAIYINQDGFGEFFDSYGRCPEKKEIKNYLKKNCKDWTVNEKLLQSPLSSTCGQYCIYFLYHRVYGVPMHRIVEVFSSDLNKNDFLVSEWVNDKFNVNTEVFEFDFGVCQLCSALIK